MDEMVNLLVDLSHERFGTRALGESLRALEAGGFSVTRTVGAEDAALAWMDEEFGGTWSSEVFAGNAAVAKFGEAFAGFAGYGARDLRFGWLRGLGAREGVGIFGPFGVSKSFRGTRAGPHLLIVALASLRELGYSSALIPAVGEEKLIAYYVKHAGANIAERFTKARWQATRFRTTVLVSGQGSNFQSVVDAVAAGALPLDITALIANDATAYALQRGRLAGIAQVSALTWERAREARDVYDVRLLEAVEQTRPELVLLLGWMHLLDGDFIARFPDLINIHPAYLPLDQRMESVGMPDRSSIPVFRGAHALRDAVAAGVGWTGATAHLVTLDADRGPGLVRRPLAIRPAETPETLVARLHPLEHRVLAGGIMRWIYER